MSEPKLIPILVITNDEPCQLLAKSLPFLQENEVSAFRYNFMIFLMREDDSRGKPLNYRCSYSIEGLESGETVSTDTMTFTPDDKRDIIKFIHAPQKLFKNEGYRVLQFNGEPLCQEDIYSKVKLWNSKKKTSN